MTTYFYFKFQKNNDDWNDCFHSKELLHDTKYFVDLETYFVSSTIKLKIV